MFPSNSFDATLCNPLDFGRLKNHLRYHQSRAVVSLIKPHERLTLSSVRASKYPGPGVSRRQATGKSGITAESVNITAELQTDMGLTMVSYPWLLGKLLLHQLSKYLHSSELHIGAMKRSSVH